MAHRVLARNASGLRHLRWAREVLGTLTALAEHQARFTPVQIAALRAEIAHVAALVSTLSGAVKPYRDFLERSRTLTRGKLRAAQILGDTAAREAAFREMSTATEPTREGLKQALTAAVQATRKGLREMDERLLASFSAEVVAGLYPALTADGSRVLDDGDPDDDAAGGPGA